MKHHLLLWFVVAAARAGFAQQAGPEGEAFDPPAGGALWRHAESGLAFPQELGDLSMEGGFAYKGGGLGVSLRYASRELRARADVYVYPCARPHGDREEIRKALMDEASAVQGELELMRQRGRYAAIKSDAATVENLDFHGGAESCRLLMPIYLTINENTGAGVTPTHVYSVLALWVYGDSWVKMRYTFPAETDSKGEEACNGFFRQLEKCVLGTDFAKELNDWIAAYRKSPLSKEAIDKGGGVVAFADALPFVSLKIGEGLMNFGSACDKQVADGNQHVLRAFIVGATDATMKGQTQAEIVAAGVREVSVVCDALRKANPKFEPPSLDGFAAAVAEDNHVTLPPSAPRDRDAKGKGAKSKS